MALYEFLGIERSALNISGPDPFLDAHNRNPATMGGTTFTVDSSGWQPVAVDDDETMFHDGDANQALAATVTMNGTTYTAGTHIENEYTYFVRPAGSTDAGDVIVLHDIKIGTALVGFAAEGRLLPGVTYEFIAGGSDGPTANYADLVVCFTPGTIITTDKGPRAIQSLRAGDKVQTLDNGYQPVAWAGRQITRGRGNKAPVRIRAGAMGNERDCYLSQQHRVLVPCASGEALVPVKALIGTAGVKVVPHRQVIYHHLLLERHEVILADGLPAESLLPGKEALKSISAQDRAAILRLFPALRQGAGWGAARPLLKPGQWRRSRGNSIGKMQ